MANSDTNISELHAAAAAAQRAPLEPGTTALDRLAAPKNLKRRMSILLIDPWHLSRECLARAVTMQAPGVAIVAVADLAEAAEREIPVAEVDVALLGEHALPAEEPGYAQALEALGARLPGVPLVVLSTREETEAILAAMQQRGVRGYIPMSLELPLVVEALQFVAAGGLFVPAKPLLDGLRERQPTPARDGGAGREAGAKASALSRIPPRQLEVLELLRKGMSNKVIAHELQMQESTVKVHVRHIMKKLGASNRTQAAFIAHQLLEQHEPAAP